MVNVLLFFVSLGETISGLTTKAQGTGPVEVYDRTHEV